MTMMNAHALVEYAHFGLLSKYGDNDVTVNIAGCCGQQATTNLTHSLPVDPRRSRSKCLMNLSTGHQATEGAFI
jgi:hypothetical protein